ncbi:MAG: hypothetical protein AB8G05_17680 [Oligoflexales bacterium]
MSRNALRVYFYQIFNSNIFSFDLRSSRFYFSDNWMFNGHVLAGNFAKTFIESLRETYDGYYLGQDNLLKKSLIGMGLIGDNWCKDDSEGLTLLVKKHFGGEDRILSRFRVKEMIHSFTEIFEFIRDGKPKLNPCFLMLGVYLTSLYMTLDSIDEDLDPHDCYVYAKQISEKAGRQLTV